MTAPEARTRIPLSVLDLAIVRRGATSAEALAETTAHAKRADELGYLRFWVAEHHNMATVASTAPTVLMAHIAANTERIKVGSGGVMLPNHAPLVVAEQFALLEALHPGRIDFGVGRAPGTDMATAAALRRGSDNRDAEDFPQNLIDVMGLLGDERADAGLWKRFRATPVSTSTPQVILLGSSGFSAQLAGILGLPFAYAHHFDMGGPSEAACDLYRSSFEPSAVLDEPYTMITASVLAAPTTEQAVFLAGPARLRKYGMRSGQMLDVLSPAEVLEHPEYEAAMRMPSSSIVGTPPDVKAGIEALAEAVGAVEVMLYTSTHSLDERLWSLEAIAAQWELG